MWKTLQNMEKRDEETKRTRKNQIWVKYNENSISACRLYRI